MDKSPHTSGFVTVKGIRANVVRLHYLDWSGSGPALLFLAGRGCNGHIFDDFAPCFTGFFRVLALDRRGHGESDCPQTSYDIDSLVEDIRQFLDCLQIERVILAGHALAGIELTRFAAQYPQRVLELVFLEAAYDYGCPEYNALNEKNPAWKIQIPGANQDSYVLGYAQIRAPTLAIYAVKKNTYYAAPDYMTPEQQVEMVNFFDNVAQPWARHSIEQFRQGVPHAKIVEILEGHHYCFIHQEYLVFREMIAFLLRNSIV